MVLGISLINPCFEGCLKKVNYRKPPTLPSSVWAVNAKIRIAEGTFILEPATHVGYQFEPVRAQNRLGAPSSGSEAERSKLSIPVTKDGRKLLRHLFPDTILIL